MAYDNYGNTGGSSSLVLHVTNTFLTLALFGLLLFFFIKMDEFKDDVNKVKNDYDKRSTPLAASPTQTKSSFITSALLSYFFT